MFPELVEIGGGREKWWSRLMGKGGSLIEMRVKLEVDEATWLMKLHG
jgi:hypothetical protein